MNGAKKRLCRSARQDPKFYSVLVLWLDESAVGDLPLTRLGALLRPLRSRVPDTRLQTKIIGPRTSDGLRALAAEAGDGVTSTTRDAIAGVKMFSAVATAEDAFFLKDPPSTQPTLAQSITSQVGGGFQFFRTTALDDLLCKTLVEELGRRGIVNRRDVEGGKISPELDAGMAHIAVVSEWDTFYGRALPISFAAAMYDKSAPADGKNGNFHQQILRGEKFPRWILQRFYLRGIDGHLPKGAGSSDASDSGNDSAKSTTTEKSARSGAASESPEGPASMDYLRRLADDLVEQDDMLRRSGKGRLRAIGVLGTDLYDKLMIMRALRPKLPGAILFTTGLDARYGLSTEWSAARNLITAAPFGLELHPDYQSAIPAFRDSDQAALFATTLVAMGALPQDAHIDEVGWSSEIRTLFDNVSPRIFEIARRGPYELTVDNEKSLSKGLYPERANTFTWYSGWRLVWIILAICLSVIIGWWEGHILGWRWSSIDPENARNWYSRSPVIGMLAALGSVGLIAFVMQFPPLRSEGPPLLWFGGISIWPTEVMRIVILAVCASLLTKVRSDVKRSNTELEDEFHLTSLDDLHRNSLSEFNPNIKSSYDMLLPAESEHVMQLGPWGVFGNNDPSIGSIDPKTGVTPPAQTPSGREHPRVYVCNLWWEYTRRGDMGDRYRRILLPCVIYGVVATALVFVFGYPMVPSRGPGIWWMDLFLAISSVVACVLLLGIMLDGAYVNKKFIDYLTAARTRWPRKFFEEQCAKWQVGSDCVWYLDIQLIARRTEIVGKFIYYPLLMFLLFILSHNSFFGNWDWPPGLIVGVGSYLALAVGGAYMLRQAAERARTTALEKLRDCQATHAAARHDKEAETLGTLAEAVENERRGAFSVLSQYPTLATVLLPSGGFGLWALVEYFAKSYAGGG